MNIPDGPKYVAAWSLVALVLLAAARPIKGQQSSAPQQIGAYPKVGGENVVTLIRRPTSNGKSLEFLSVTLFPGRGMNVFQITANVPGHGEQPLLKSPSVAGAARQLNGTGPDEFGNLSHSFGGALLIPFTSRIGGELSPDGKTVNASWNGQTIHLPMDFLGKYAVHGLINQSKVSDIRTKTTTNGQTLTGVIHAGDFDGHWLSDTDIHLTIRLTGAAISLTVTAKNVGHDPEPMGMGWHPYLSIPSGDRSQARVHLPAAARTDADADGRPTGRLIPVEGTPYDFTAADGARLDQSMALNFSHLTRTHGIVDAWLADPKWNYGIRIEGLSSHIKTLYLYSPKNDTFSAIEEQFNFPDPFGDQWKGMNTGMVTLRPGESTTWKVRLKLFTPKTN